MSAALSVQQRAAISRRLADGLARIDRHCDEWFPEQRAFYDDPAQLVAAVCSRRAGKTRGGCPAMLRSALRSPGKRFLYINETRAEAIRLAWYGNAGDGMRSLAIRLKLQVRLNESDLTIHIQRDASRPELDTWIQLLGADDEAGVRKALGGAYAEVWWDEAQKIPTKLTQVIRETLLPTLVDHGGRLRLTGTPSRQMAGLFYEVTRTDGKALEGWKVYRWNGLANPHFGRVIWKDGGWAVVTKFGTVDSWHAARADADARCAAVRYRDFVDELQRLFGGPDVAPVDGPLMQREAFGRWVHEDASYTYDVHKVPASSLVYAPNRPTLVTIAVARIVGDGQGGERLVHDPVQFNDFPDLERSLLDLPGRGAHHDWSYTVGADIGYNDPFAWVLWAWCPRLRPLYEVASWRRKGLDAAVQAAVLRHIMQIIPVGSIVADAGGSNLPTVKGWSTEWIDRWQLPLEEADKANKATAIVQMNAEIRRGHVLYRDGGPLLDEARRVQWTRLPSGRLIEDPSIPNDTTDAGLYGHRRSYAFRHQHEDPPPPPGSKEAIAAAEARLLQEIEDEEADELEPVWP